MRTAWLCVPLLLAACQEQQPRQARSSWSTQRPVSTSSSSPVEASPLSTAAHVDEQARPMVVSLTRDFCLPCQVMKPWIEQLRREQIEAVDVVVVNIDRERNRRFAHHFGMETVPTLVFVSPTGHIEARHEGVATQEQMTATLRRLGWLR